MEEQTAFSYETSGSRREIAASLQAVVAQLSGTGPITLAAGDERVTVAPAGDVELEVEVEREATDDGDAVELEVELEWTEAEEPPATRQTTDSPQTTESADEPGQATEEHTDEVDAAGPADEEATDDGDADTDAPGAAGHDVDANVDAGVDAPATVDFDSVSAPGAGEHAVVESAGSQATFEVFRDAASEWRWRLVHRNGNVVATSGEGYTRRRNAEKGLGSVVANAPGAEVVDDLQ